MASRIKGITVEIGGDTTGLDKALKSVNSSIKTTQSGLKDVSKLLKLDPTNTELLTQKQKMLKDAIGSTKEKLDALKLAQEQAKAQLESGDLGQDKYDALQREIIETEQELKRLQEQAIESNAALAKIEEVGDKLQTAGDKISGAGQKLLPVTAAVAGLGTAAVKTTADFDTSMSQVQATMGITKDAMSELNGESVNTVEALRDLAKQMGSETAFSASECADAMNYLALAGYDTQEIYDTLPTVLNLAAAGGIDLASASDMVTDAMSALGMETSEADTMVDQMSKTASTTNTSVAQLGEAILTIGATAKTVKGGTAELNTALGILANNGIKGAEGGTHLRNVILALQSPTDKAAACMESLGVEVYDSEGNMRSLNDILGDLNTSMDGMTSAEKQNIISSIFNKTDLAAVNSLLSNTGDSWDSLQQSITESGGAAQQMADTQLDNLSGQITILKSALEGLAISFGEILMPKIRAAAKKIQEFVDKLNGMNDEQKETVLKIAAVVAAIGPMLILFGKVTSTVGTAMKGFSGLTKGIAKLGVKIAGSSGSITGLGSALGAVAGPVLAVVAVIGTLAAAFATLWKTNDEFRENIIGTWNQIKETISGFCQGIVDRLNSLGFEFESITEVLSAVWQGFCDLLAPVFEGVFNHIANTLSTVLDVILGIVDVFISVFQGDWSGAWEAVKGIFTTMWEGLVSWFENILGTLKGVADVVLGWFGTSWDEVWNAVSTTFTNIWNGIITFFSNTWETIKNVVSVGIQFIGSLLEAAWDIITLPFQLIWENCGDTITSIWETIKTTVGNAINAVSTTLSSVMNAIQTTISTIWTAISTKISTVVNSIKTTVSTVFNAIKTTATTIWNGIKTSIFTVVDGVKTKVTTVFNSVKSTLSSVFSSIKSTATSVWNGIKSAITGPIDQAKTHISNALNSIKSFFANCKLSLPHIKMPHFSISGSFSLNPPSVPHLSVSWYKEGGIMTDPTLFGFNGSSLMAGGEAGPEAILPLKSFYTKLEAMLDSKLNMRGMEKYLAVIARNSEKGIYLDGSTLVGKLAPGMNRQLGILAAQEVYR
ncbi:MAG: phage tail tape measure protein [Eubacteriales bacterium]|nr:phage tail tape measure protein [Eubacteriales bacterium]